MKILERDKQLLAELRKVNSDNDREIWFTGKEWADVADKIWERLCEDLISALENTENTQNWRYLEMLRDTKRILHLSTVEPFAAEVAKPHSFIRCYEHYYSESYKELREHLRDAPLFHGFTTAGEDHHFRIANHLRRVRELCERSIETLEHSIEVKENAED